MSAFVALNIEADDGSDEEIDDSKEIQAPSSFQQDENYGDADYEDVPLDGVDQASDAIPAINANETPSTLPQILYLAYKNYGQFLLDQLRSKVSQSKKLALNSGDTTALDPEQVRGIVLASLHLLIEATDRDDTDLQLWRLISRLCEFLGSRRLARYCLEAALETDDGIYDAWPEPQGLDESLAAEQLQRLLGRLSDNVAESEISNLPGRKRGLVTSLKKFVDPCPYLPTPPETPGEQSLASLLETPTEKQDIIVPMRTWESVGKSILLLITKVAQGQENPDFGTAYRVVLPSVVDSGSRSAISLKDGGISSSLAKDLRTDDTLITIVPGKEGDVEQNESSPKVEMAFENPASVEQGQILHNPRDPQAVPDEFALEKVEKNPASLLQEQCRSLQTDQTVDKFTEAGPLQPAIPESPRTMSLPTRKRSSEVAGLAESIDTGRSKSKRIKARVSIVDGPPEDTANQYEQQLQEFVIADDSLFKSAGVALAKLNANRLGALDTLRTSIAHMDQSPVDTSDVVVQDLRYLLTSWNLEKSNLFLRKSKESDDFSGVNGARNFTAFLEDSKRGSQKGRNVGVLSKDNGLDDFVDSINLGWTQLDQLALAWIERLLSPRAFPSGAAIPSTSIYETQKWPESLKKVVVQIMVQRDQYIYTTLRDRLDALEHQFLTRTPDVNSDLIDDREEAFLSVVQHIFEIHLDIYERITNPSSEVDQETRVVQLDRLGRWSSLATNAISKRPLTIGTSDALDQLVIRFLWSSVLYVNLTDPSARDHVIMCFEDLKRTLQIAGNPVTKLQNNAAMPEVSLEALESEISSLTTMDFFLGIFSSDNSEPLAIIETLEPMLDNLVSNTDMQGERGQEAAIADRSNEDSAGIMPNFESMASDHQLVANPKIDSMVSYLRKASLPLRLYLWQKLGSAYEAISYPPRVLSCNFRRMELIVNYLLSHDHLSSAKETRQLDLLGWLRDLDTLVTSSLSLTMQELNAFEFIDRVQLQSAMSAMSALQRILHVYMLWKDAVRVGQTPTFQPPRGSALTSHTASMTKFENLQVKSWMLQYMLVKEAIVQEPSLFELPSQYLLEHLNLLHDSLGLRDLCGLQHKRFLKLIKSEMLKHKADSGLYTAILKDGTSNWDRDFAQIIFDLHSIKILPSWWGLRYHGCTPDILDREAALEIMDFVIIYANRMNIKDLAKNELKGAIDKIQAAIKLPTATIDTTFNKRSITLYLKTAINPLEMYRSFRGVIDLPSIEISNESAVIAAKGWYYILGHLSLAKFRAQNRTIPGPLDDLDNATIYFRQDLELGIEKWETWYRLAQVYDVKIEEYTKWNANKLNTAMEELKALQRNAIHCYTMAVATASRANASLEDVAKIPDLYHDFAMRVYASTREPYSMKAFGLEDFERHFNSAETGMYKGKPFKGLQLYAAWNFSKVLLQRALARKPKAWASWYLLGKCLWKMHDCSDQVLGSSERMDHVGVLNAFKRAVETVQDRRDKDAILEPHYKLLSIVYKLVQRNQLQIPAAYDQLRVTPYARKVLSHDNPSRWHQSIMEVLKVLRAADKQNWHHRMAARAAHMAYDNSPDNVESAQAAKEELTQQIFTKTMNIQVWRPEHERAGRHFVYTTRYVNFFVRLLIQLGDTATLEALAKKIRKKAGDFIGHADLWDSICGQYLNLLRFKGSIQHGQFDRMFKTVPLEIFMLNADRLETYAHQPEFDSLLIELIRETIELRKLNSNLMKATAIDDLIGDAYACLYEKVLPEMTAKFNDEENRVRMRVDHVLASGLEASATGTPPPPDQAGGKVGDVQPTKTRAKGVTRREVQKRAETLVARSTAAMVAANAAKLAEPESAPVVAAVQPEAEAEAGALDGLSPRAAAQDGDGDGDGKDGASSVPGSVHDSADDESELSEVEEFVDAPEEAIGMPSNNVGGDQRVEEDDDDEEEEEAEQGFNDVVEGDGADGDDEEGEEQEEQEDEDEEGDDEESPDVIVERLGRDTGDRKDTNMEEG